LREAQSTSFCVLRFSRTARFRILVAAVSAIRSRALTFPAAAEAANDNPQAQGAEQSAHDDNPPPSVELPSTGTE
jgi:hypothetical protein